MLQQLQASSSGGPPLPYLFQAEFASEQTFGSFSWMSAILPPLQTVATAPGEAFTAKDMPTLFARAGFARVGQQVAHAAKYDCAKPPGVETHAIFGSGHQTPFAFNFPLGSDHKVNFSTPCHYSYDATTGNAFYPARCTVNTTDGDNTGTRDSLAGVPSRWQMAQPQPVHIVEVRGVSHDDLQKSSAAMQYVREVLVNTSKRTSTPATVSVLAPPA
jgi:hypothetical protein